MPNNLTEEFRKKVIDDILKTGFGSELRAIRILSESSSWSVQAGIAFYDNVLNVSRELDFVAYLHRFRQRQPGEMLFRVTIGLIAEVKKSERPWAVMRNAVWKTPELPFLMNAKIKMVNSKEEASLRKRLAVEVRLPRMVGSDTVSTKYSRSLMNTEDGSKQRLRFVELQPNRMKA